VAKDAELVAVTGYLSAEAFGMVDMPVIANKTHNLRASGGVVTLIADGAVEFLTLLEEERAKGGFAHAHNNPGVLAGVRLSPLDVEVGASQENEVAHNDKKGAVEAKS
jgi:hypothetical protein